MITYERARIKLVDLAKDFDRAIMKRDWHRAKFLYNKALNVSTFLELSEEDRKWLWGYGEEDEAGNVYFVRGVFNRDYIRQMETECIKARIETRDFPVLR